MTDEKELRARLSDLVRRAERGEIAYTGFLSPEELCAAGRYLDYNAPHLKYITAGGFPEAERRVIVLFPDFADDSFVEDYDLSEIIKAIFIRSSGYEKLGHPAYMGSVLGCGIERSSVGDIMLTESGAAVFLLSAAADYLMSYERPLTRVGRDKVALSIADPALISSLKREYEEAAFNIPSERIDAIAAEIAGLSREKIKEVIERGDVRLNYEEATDGSARFSEGDVISVRGRGKYIIKELKQTRRGRLRVTALKYK